MYSRWTSHLKTEEEKTAFQNDILSARDVLKRLTQMLDEDVEMLEKSDLDQRVYSIPNWSHLQAHKNGNRQSYAAIRQMIDLDQQKEPVNNERNTIKWSAGRPSGTRPK